MKKKRLQNVLVSVLVIALILGTSESSLFGGRHTLQAKPAAEQAAARLQKAQGNRWSEQKEKRAKDATFWSRADGANKVLLYTEDIRYPHSGTKKWVDYRPVFVSQADSPNRKKSNRSGYYEDRRGDFLQSVPPFLGEDTPIVFEDAEASFSLLPLDEQGKALRTPKQETQEIRTPVTDPYGKETDGISGVSYTTKTGTQYRYQPYIDGLKETVIIPSHTKQQTLSYILTTTDAYAEADGKKVTRENRIRGEEIRMIGNDQQSAGMFSPMSVTAPEGEDVRGTGFYTIQLVKEIPKGRHITRTYRLSIEAEIPADRKADGAPLCIESFLSSGEPKASSSEDKASLLTFDSLPETLAGKFIQTANVIVTETEDSPAGQNAAVYAGPSPREAVSETAPVRPVSPGAIHRDTEEAVRPEGEPLGRFVTSGTAGTTQSVDVTEYLCEVLQGERADRGFQIAADAPGAEEAAAWFTAEDSPAISARPVLAVTYYDEPEAPLLNIEDVEQKTGKDTVVRWREATAHSLGYIQYRIARMDPEGKKETKDIVPYAKATKLGVKEHGSVTIPTARLAEGSYRIGIRSVDTQGNGGQEEATILRIDGTPPQMKPAALKPAADRGRPSRQSPVLSWSGVRDAQFAGVEYAVNGGKYVTAGETRSGALVIGAAVWVSEQENTLSVRAIDRAGNVSREQRFSYFYDNTEPRIQTVTLHPRSEEANVRPSVSVTYEIEDPTLSEVRLRVDRGEWIRIGTSGSGRYDIPASSLPRANVSHIELHAVDRAGNIGRWVGLYEEPRQSGAAVLSETPRADAEASEPDIGGRSLFADLLPAYPDVLSSPAGSAQTVSASSGVSAFAAAAATAAPNRLGKKEHLPYADFSTGNASGSVEETTGNLYYQMPVITVPMPTLFAGIAPHYNSQSTEDQGMGAGWRINYSETVQELRDASGVLYGYRYQDETGAEYRMDQYHAAEGGYRSPEHPDISIRDSGTGYWIKEKGGVDRYFRASDGKLSLIDEPNGDYLSFSYDAVTGYLKSIQTSTEKFITFHYGQHGGHDRLRQITFPDGSTLSYTYTMDDAPFAKVMYQKEGKSMLWGEYGYDYHTGHYRLNAVSDGNRNAYRLTYQYTDGAKVTQIRQPNGDTTDFVYGEKETNVHTAWDGVRQTSETIRFNERGDVTERRDVFGMTTSYIYQVGNPQPISESRGVLEQELSASGEILTNRVNVFTDYTYDSSGNITKEVDEQGNTTTYEYQSTSPPARHSPTLIWKKDNAGVTVSKETFAYDEKGNEIQSGEEVSQTQTITTFHASPSPGPYDVVSRESSTSADQGLESGTSAVGYDADGNPVDEYDTAGGISSRLVHQYDGMGRLLTTREYQIEEGEETLIQTTSRRYDAWGREIETSTRWAESQEVETESKQYDANGNIIQETSPEGVVTDTSYDTMNRVTKQTVTHPGSAAEPVIHQETEHHYTYEDLRIYDGTGTSPAEERMLKTETVTRESQDGTVVKNTKEVRYQNGLGQVVRTLSGGIYTDYTYDALGRCLTTYVMGESIRATGGQSTCQLYDTAGNVIKTVVNPKKSSPDVTPAPTAAPPAATVPPGVPAGYEALRVSNYRLSGGTAEQGTQGLTVTNANSVAFPLPWMGSPGDTISVIVLGSHAGTRDFRSFLTTDALQGVSNIVFGKTGSHAAYPYNQGFRWEYTLTVAEEATHLIFKGPDSVTDLDDLTITSLAVKKQAGSTEQSVALNLGNTANYKAFGPGATVSRNTAEQAVAVHTVHYGQGAAFARGNQFGRLFPD